MINLASYIFFFLGNFLIVILAPNLIIDEFLTNYSFICLIFGPLNFILFSKFFEKKIIISKIIILLNILSFFYYDNFFLIILIYVINIFFSDFLFSQLRSKKINFIFKFISFIIPLLLLFDLTEFKNILLLRLHLSTLFLIIVLFQNVGYEKLEIKHPLPYQIFMNLNYYLPLFIVTFLLDGFLLKLTYIFFQVGFSLILKFDDLKIRKIIDEHQFSYYQKYFNLFIILSPIFLIYFNISFLIIFFYYFNIILFYQIKKKTL
jgi:hypothetical protein